MNGMNCLNITMQKSRYFKREVHYVVSIYFLRIFSEYTKQTQLLLYNTVALNCHI